MVWLVEGTLNSEPVGEFGADALPPTSQHYLRPGRLYRVGRAGGVRAPPKPGQTKPGPASRHRPYDFRIANLAVPKEGLATFETGGGDDDDGGDLWDPVDRPDQPSNHSPYPLTVTVGKKFALTRASGETVELASDTRVEVRDGDRFEERNKGFWFRFTWRPLSLCFTAASAEKKKQHAAEAKRLGIKIGYKEFRHHHTHLLTKSAAPTAAVMQAAMYGARIVAPSFWDDLVVAGTTNPFPPRDRLSVRPSRPEDNNIAEEATVEERSQYDKALLRWERELLELEPDVGADSGRWWGHCSLEKDFTRAWPDEVGKNLPAKWNDQDPKRWAIPRPERKRIFKGILFVSLHGDADSDALHSSLVTLGGGTFFSCSLLLQGPLPASITPILDAIASFKVSNGLSADHSRIVLFPPEGVLDPDPAAASQDEASLLKRQRALVNELQRALKTSQLCHPDGRDLITAIYELSSAALFEGDAGIPNGDDQRNADMVTSAAKAGPAQATQAFTQATPPFPTGGIPDTHPESSLPVATASESIPAASLRDSLTRRARIGRSVLNSMLDDLPNEQGGAFSAARARAPSRTIDSMMGEESAMGALSESMSLDPATATIDSQTRHRERMPRRRAGRSAVDLLLQTGSDSPERERERGSSARPSGAEETQSIHEDLMRTHKTRQERLKAIEEEDERLARLEQRERDKSQGRALEEESATSTRTGGKRRRAVAQEASGDEGDGRAGKRGSRKGGDALVSTTRKRTRAQSRDLTAGSTGSSSDEDGASLRRGARKRSRAPRSLSPQETASTLSTAPRNRQEAASQKKIDKAAREAEAQRLLQLKPTKRRGAEADNQFTEEFNALKIVKPKLQAMPAQEHRRMRWDEEDSDAERDRLIVEAQEHANEEDGDEDMDPDHWRRPTQAMFVLRTFDVDRKERAQPRAESTVEERWAGRPNFKKFRPKNSKSPRLPLAQRPQVELTIPEVVDFGLGPGYNGRKETGASQVRRVDDDDDDDDEEELLGAARSGKTGAKSKSNRGPATHVGNAVKKARGKAPPKGKGKAKQVVVDSDEDEQDELFNDGDSSIPTSSHTLHDDFDELEDDEGHAPLQRATGRVRSATATATASRASSRKPGTTILVHDSDSDSDSGLTFKGFGKKAAIGRVRR